MKLRIGAALALLVVLQSAVAQGAAVKGQEFAFNNAGEPETLDPTLATGVPEQNIFLGLFEGLTTLDPRTLEVLPGIAKAWQVSDGGKRYSFYLRDNAVWSNGRRIVANDFVYAWRRLLEPATAAPYAYHLYYVVGAHDFNAGKLKDFSKVGISAPSPDVLEVRLEYPTPYFPFLCAFYSLAPVPQEVISKFGNRWTRPENIVTNGPFQLGEWRPNERLVLTKSLSYWDKNAVSLQRVIIYPVENKETTLNLYMTGKLHWTGQTTLPEARIPLLKKRPDYHEPLRLGTYFLRLNTTKPPLNNLDVRQALYLAIDREAIVRNVTKSGEIAAQSVTPDVLPGYVPPKGPAFNPTKAALHLSQAGFCAPGYMRPGCKQFPRLEVLYNTNERNKLVLLAIQQMWKRFLGMQEVQLVNREWKVYIKEQRQMDYLVSRAGWTADYPDAMTFVELFVKDGGNNSTGWSNARFDALIQGARLEMNPDARFANIAQAEQIVLEELPVLPIYHYTSPFMLDMRVGGFYENTLDLHPYKSIYIKSDAPNVTSPATAPGGKRE